MAQAAHFSLGVNSYSKQLVLSRLVRASDLDSRATTKSPMFADWFTGPQDIQGRILGQRSRFF
jgi:hypothetical protein